MRPSQLLLGAFGLLRGLLGYFGRGRWRGNQPLHGIFKV